MYGDAFVASVNLCNIDDMVISTIDIILAIIVVDWF